VEFKAGKCAVGSNGTTVTPDKRKGLVQLFQASDSLMHLTWKDRTTGQIEDDLIIFPEDAALKKLKQIPRVLLLEFKSSSRKLFFWIQESSADKDDEYISKVNDNINNPPNPDQPQAPALVAPSLRSGTPSQQPARAPGLGAGLDLESMLASMGVPRSSVSSMLSGASAPSSSQPPQSQSQPRPTPQNAPAATPTLQQIINAEAILPILSSPQVQSELLPYLPEGRRTPEELHQILRSPQFQQSMESFSSALQSGQLGELLRQFGLDSTGVEGFLRALQRQVERQQQQQDPSKK